MKTVCVDDDGFLRDFFSVHHQLDDVSARRRRGASKAAAPAPEAALASRRLRTLRLHRRWRLRRASTLRDRPRRCRGSTRSTRSTWAARASGRVASEVPLHAIEAHVLRAVDRAEFLAAEIADRDLDLARR